MQHTHVLAVCPTGILQHQGVVAASKRRRRVHLFAVDVASERSRLPHQPIDQMTVIDPLLRRPTQPLHDQNLLACIPHLDRLRADAGFHLFADQPRGHGVGVLLHLDRAAAAHAHFHSLQRVQTTTRQRQQSSLLLLKRLRSAAIPTGHEGTQALRVLLSALEIPAAAQLQFLIQRILEAPMALLAIAVFVAAGGIGRFGRHAIVAHQGPILRRELLGVAFAIHGQRHAIGAMAFRHGTQFPQGILKTFAQTGETLREADRHVLPVRTRQHEVIEQVREGLARDCDAERVHVSEVRRTQPARLVYLAEIDFLGRPLFGLPLPNSPLHGSLSASPVLVGISAFKPLDERLGLERRFPLQHLFQLRPDIDQRIDASPPGVGNMRFAGQFAAVAVLASGFAIHACFHRRGLQRCL